MNSPSTALLIVALFGATWSLGCQGQRATRYAVEGTVTFDGKPVPSGVIRFEPASGNGLIAPMGYAVIRQGRYKTELDQGSGAGRYFAKVTGGDGVLPGREDAARKLDPEQPAKAEGIGLGNEWFRDYSQEIDLPAANATIDVDVPKSAATKLTKIHGL